MNSEEKKALVQDILNSHMTGKDEFHSLMQEATRIFNVQEFADVTSLIAIFPKEYSGCIDIIYQLLTTILTAKRDVQNTFIGAAIDGITNKRIIEDLTTIDFTVKDHLYGEKEVNPEAANQ